jgi:hypothetical protein
LGLEGQDVVIEKHNKKVKTAFEGLAKANTRVQRFLDVNNPEGLEKALKAQKKADATYVKAVDSSAGVFGTGSGKVPFLLPHSFTGRPPF